MVVTYHLMVLWSQHFAAKATPWSNGGAGVDIFFVISGVVMAISSSRIEGTGNPAIHFLKHRLIRIMPVYWIFTLALLLQRRMQPTLSFHQLALPWHYVVASFLLIPARNSLGQISPIVGVGWTLSFEMFFYLLITVALLVKLNVYHFMTVVIVSLAIAGMFYKDSWPVVAVLVNPILLEFLAGLWIGRALQKQVHIKPAISAVLGILGIIGIATLPQGGFPGSRVLGWGTCAVLIVQAAVMLEGSLGRLPKLSLLIGDASYSLYLMHDMLLSLVVVILSKVRAIKVGVSGALNESVMIALCLAIAVFAALLFYIWIEKPMNAYLRRGGPFQKAHTVPV